MNCKNCGAELYEGATFCGNCGMKTEREQKTCEQPVCEEPVTDFHQEVHNEYQEQGSYVPPVMPEFNNGNSFVPIEKPNTVLWIVLAAIETFSCCQITGIVSLIYAILGHVAADKGDFADAGNKIKTAKTWFFAGLAIGIIFWIAYFFFVAILFAAGITEEFLYY